MSLYSCDNIETLQTFFSIRSLRSSFSLTFRKKKETPKVVSVPSSFLCTKDICSSLQILRNAWGRFLFLWDRTKLLQQRTNNRASAFNPSQTHKCSCSRTSSNFTADRPKVYFWAETIDRNITVYSFTWLFYSVWLIRGIQSKHRAEPFRVTIFFLWTAQQCLSVSHVFWTHIQNWPII